MFCETLSIYIKSLLNDGSGSYCILFTKLSKICYLSVYLFSQLISTFYKSDVYIINLAHIGFVQGPINRTVQISFICVKVNSKTKLYLASLRSQSEAMRHLSLSIKPGNFEQLIR